MDAPIPPLFLPGVGTVFGDVHVKPGNASLESHLHLSTGAVTVEYPVSIQYTLPDEYVPGRPITVQTALTRLGPATMQAITPGSVFH